MLSMASKIEILIVILNTTTFHKVSFLGYFYSYKTKGKTKINILAVF